MNTRTIAAILLSLSGLACAGPGSVPGTGVPMPPPNPDHAKRSGDRPMPEGTVMLSPEHGASRRQNDPTVSPRRPIVPPGQGNRHGIVWGLYKICVDQAGAVAKVSTVKTSGDQLDHDWSDIIRTWRYRPHLLGGQPTAFCYPTRVELLVI
jgi:hypothetical protein